MRTVCSLLICLSLWGCSNTSYPDSGEVPESVEKSFRKDYPNVEVVGWEQEDKRYKVEFEEEGVGWEVEYDVKGTRVSTSSEVSEDKLPADASSYIITNFSGYEVDEVRQTRLSNGKLFYEVTIKKADAEKELVFKENGEFMHQNDQI